MLSDVHFHDDKDWVRRWRLFRTLIEWACDLVRSSSNPGSVERAWFAASFELLELAQDRTFLYGIEPGATPERVLSIDDEYRGNVNHLAHGLGRFPDNPTFRLLRLEGHADLWEGVAYWIATETTVPASSLDAMQGQAAAIRARRNRREGPRHPSDMDIVRRAEFLAELLKARERIQSFQLVQEVAARIHLDLGLIALCLGDRALGLTELSKADAAAGDDKLKFLSRFLQGRIHGRQGQTALSEAAYRSALTLRPDSQSAVVALAEILFTDGRRREAVELADRAVALKRLSEHRLRPRDPWLEFFEHGRLTSEQPFLGLRRALFQ